MPTSDEKLEEILSEYPLKDLFVVLDRHVDYLKSCPESDISIRIVRIINEMIK